MSALEKLIETDRNMAGYTAERYRKLIEKASLELALKNKAIELAIITLREVVHDRPSAHNDDVWEHIILTLSELESLR